MNRPLLATFAGAVIALLTPFAPASSHHSHAMFASDREVTVTGTVSGVRYANPHVYLRLAVADENGATSTWTVEMSTIGNMSNRGISANSFQEGYEVTITMNPLRNGQSGGNYIRIESINGVLNAASGNNWAPDH
ncbi:DUF6152 family protein [Candidatus Rariloculus sp.]|uniref:DUF6152 family protein n=1 Tax=Candidatus Rariloculus sp. TaxID=3101265 RepID=UPI003D0CD31B